MHQQQCVRCARLALYAIFMCKLNAVYIRWVHSSKGIEPMVQMLVMLNAAL